MVKKIVITGAAGFVGSHVYDHFASAYPNSKIIILDKMTYAADIRNLVIMEKHPKHSLVVEDVSNLNICIKVTKNADLVIHLAAESHVDNSFGNSMVFTKSNTLGTHVLMEACKRNNVKKIIHVSTDEVYGENTNGIFFEEDQLNPTNPYSAAKAGAEMIVKSYCKSFKLPVITVRANNIYGIRQYPEKIIPRFCLRALKNLPLMVHGDGSNLRHYLSASDFASALEVLWLKGSVGEVYNVASEFELSNLEMAKVINSIIRPKSGKIKFISDRPFNDSRYHVNDKKIRDLGWRPQNSLLNDLPNIINWYKKNFNRFTDIKI